MTIWNNADLKKQRWLYRTIKPQGTIQGNVGLSKTMKDYLRLYRAIEVDTGLYRPVDDSLGLYRAL